MAFELLITFVSPDMADRVRSKERVMAWLESIGRTDIVEGVIDGVETELTDVESDTGLTTDERLAASPVALFDESEGVSRELWRELHNEFGAEVRANIHEITDDSWQRCWRESFTEFRTGKFFIAPLGDALTTPDGLIRVEIDAAGGAFGTGQHATTRAIIEMLETKLPSWSPKSVLDVGTGTGIYLILCHHLGVSRLAGTEISEDLVELAQANCDAAGVTADIRLADTPEFTESFDLIIANILVPVLHDLMPAIVALLASGGRLIVAGFVDKEEGPLVAKAQKHGLQVESLTSENGWKCVVLRV